MAKQKTKQAARKRFEISSKGKFRRRAVKQAHFNARATGEETRRKHGAQPVSPTDIGRLEKLLPHI